MKTNVKLLLVIAFFASACTTGSMVTSGSYSDDAYFTPGDHPPVVGSRAPSYEQQEKHSSTISGLRQEEAGKIVDNYLSDQKEGNSNSDNYALNGEQAYSDTTYMADEEARDLISDYDEPEDIDYTTRIRTFYDPYAYDPFWDSCYYPGIGFGWGLGFGGFYSGFGFGFGGLYGGYYNPYFGGWGYPYGYYGGLWGGYYGGGYWDRHHDGGMGRDRYYGRQNPGGRGNSNAIGFSGTGRGAVSSTFSGGRSISRTLTGTSGITSRNSNVVKSGTVVGSTRLSGTRYTVNPNVTRSANLSTSGQSRTINPQTITNLRRGQVTGQTAPSVKSATTPGGASRYTPTYSRPRTNIQSSYNSGATRQYSRPQSYSGTSSGSGRAAVSRSYQSGSSRAPSVSSAPSRSGGQVSGSSYRSSPSSGSYSAPSRSSSGSSFSGGGGGSSRSSSGGSSSGGGGRRR